MPETDAWNRRRYLKLGATTLTAGLSSANAGCLGLLPPVGQEVRYGRVDVPAPETTEPVYRRWMPAPSAVDQVSTGDVDGWLYSMPGNLGQEQLGAAFTLASSIVKTGLDYYGTDLANYGHVVGVGNLGGVVEGNVDRDHVGETLVNSGYETAGTYRDYDLYDRTDVPRRVAVSDSAIVQSNGDNRQTHTEIIVDAGDGRLTRRHEADESFATFTDWLGAYPSINNGFDLGDSTVDESALTYTFDDEAAYFIHKFLYPESQTPSKREMQRLIEERVDRAVHAWSVDIEIDDPQVSVEMRVAKDEFSGLAGGAVQPHVTWGLEYGDQNITARHEAGDSIQTDNLRIEPDDVLAEPLEGDSLEPGDTVTFDRDRAVSYGATIRVIYEFPDTENGTALLFSFDPDENDTDT